MTETGADYLADWTYNLHCKVGLVGEVDWSTYVPEINGGFKDVIKGSRMWDELGSIVM